MYKLSTSIVGNQFSYINVRTVFSSVRTGEDTGEMQGMCAALGNEVRVLSRDDTGGKKGRLSCDNIGETTDGMMTETSSCLPADDVGVTAIAGGRWFSAETGGAMLFNGILLSLFLSFDDTGEFFKLQCSSFPNRRASSSRRACS